MSIQDYLKTLNIDQLYEIREQSREMIQKHNEQSRIPVWSVVVGGMGAGDFVNYANAMTCMIDQMTKTVQKIEDKKLKGPLKVDFLKECKSSIDLFFLTESEAKESCEDYSP